MPSINTYFRFLKVVVLFSSQHCLEIESFRKQRSQVISSAMHSTGLKVFLWVGGRVDGSVLCSGHFRKGIIQFRNAAEKSITGYALG